MDRETGLSHFLTGRAVVGRSQFLACGIVLFLVKYFVDLLVARTLFDRFWSLSNYLPQVQASLVLEAVDHGWKGFAATMLALAVPFVVCGVCLTLARLRDAALPMWLVFLFFVPLINFFLFLVLCVVPQRPQNELADAATSGSTVSLLGRVVPKSSPGSASVAVVLSGGLGACLALFDGYALGVYGLGVFVGLPFSLGLVAALICGLHGTRGLWSCIGVSIGGSVTALVILLVGGFEGAICLLMAFPLVFACAGLGGAVGYAIQVHTPDQRDAALLIIGLGLLVPAIMGAEHAWAPASPLLVVRSSIEIDATPSTVWPRVVRFPDLPPPTEWVFRTGVAYPTAASIDGIGVGAERRCHFSTGTFVEPIEVWDEPRLLRFAVTHNPPPMREWSPFGDVHPPHLHGFLVSRAGQFELTPLADGGTRLEGSTWYQHGMWPDAYWRLWSDFIIHRIHLRVLRHIRTLSENQGNADASADFVDDPGVRAAERGRSRRGHGYDCRDEG